MTDNPNERITRHERSLVFVKRFHLYVRPEHGQVQRHNEICLQRFKRKSTSLNLKCFRSDVCLERDFSKAVLCDLCTVRVSEVGTVPRDSSLRWSQLLLMCTLIYISLTLISTGGKAETEERPNFPSSNLKYYSSQLLVFLVERLECSFRLFCTDTLWVCEKLSWLSESRCFIRSWLLGKSKYRFAMNRSSKWMSLCAEAL